jgi:hypothetical protein
MGQLLLEYEEVISKLMIQHDLQWSDLMGLTLSYLKVHFPKGREEYMDGTHPKDSLYY